MAGRKRLLSEHVSRQLIQVCQVLVPSRGSLVGLEMREADKGNRDTIEDIFDPVGITLRKVDAGDRCGDLDPDGGHTQADDLPRLQEQLRGKLRRIEAEFLQGQDDSIGIGGLDGNPYVHIGSRPWITMVGHGVAADQEVLNLVGAE